MERMGLVLNLRPDAAQEYKRLHATVWPGIVKLIADCNIHNYSIFLKQPENLLFAYFEYGGTDFQADMARMASNPEMRRWWDICEPLQEPLSTRAAGEWWARMEQVFFTA